ncbi:MAG TPA: TonB-dependent receptor [Candidatus Acidoferrales bacterium]|nr:TonB-dependent receptor [Candidatus Acidoferrales bacterium]
MKRGFGVISILVFIFAVCWIAPPAWAQAGNSGTIEGTVKDPTGATVPGAAVEIANPVSEYRRAVTTGQDGSFRFTNVPFNPYHLTVKATGFAAYTQDVDVRSGVPLTVAIALKLATASSTVVVEENGGDLIENDSTFHTDVDRKLFDRLPLESQSSSVSSLVTLATPGVAADSNGLFHGLGDHAENSFSVDGQPITDQQSKVFSNQIPADSIQSLEVISGAPPAEYGDKTSLVINVTTRSGLGVNQPTGSVYSSYGSFGSANAGVDLAYGGKNWGNFVSISGLNTGRFLDPPQFSVIHDKGNEENVFDRVDYAINSKDTVHLNLGYTRSWFQTPNSFDNLQAGILDPFGNPVPATDQRSKIGTFNIAPSWTHLFNSSTLFTFTGFVRRDAYNYYPSADPFSDLAPASIEPVAPNVNLPNLQNETVSQNRSLLNAGARADISYVKGIHNIKGGVTYEQTFLDEHDRLGIVNQYLNSPCLDATGMFPSPAFVGGVLVNDPAQCAGLGFEPNTAANLNNPSLMPFNPALACLDLTRPTPAASSLCANSAAALFPFNGHTDVKELALYLQDTITVKNWSFNLGMRGDFYNGLTVHREPEPRLGAAYNIKGTNTVLRVSYARILETPFNENLVLSNSGCASPVLNPLLLCATPVGQITPFSPGWRNEFHVGLQQAFGRYLVVDGEYIWKYTHNAYDFSVLGNTPITFPIEWHSSKIPGVMGRISMPNFHGFSAFVVMSSVAARFFNPQLGGAGATPGGPVGSVFRIDHDEHFNETTHLQYQPWKLGPWFGFNWRYDSGLVAGAVPFATDTTTPVDLTGLSAAQQIEAGLFCGTQKPTLAVPLTSCAPNLYGSSLVKIPAPGTENDDHNPPRIAPRHLFDAAVGHDNLFRGDRYKWSLRFSVINLTNKVALYNFLSTFSGTHYVTPRTETIELGFHF